MRVDDQFMTEVGLGEMPQAEKEAFMKHAEEELEIRVGQGVGAQLTDALMDEFDQLTDLDQAATWLEQHVPNYREITEQIYQNFKQEILAERQAILGQ